MASKGRLDAGIGAGWHEHEWRAYGYGFPETRDRMRAFREAVQIIHDMWTEDKPTFAGEYYSDRRPDQRAEGRADSRTSPLWIGGGGEKVTLRLVARYGDACNVGGGNPETVRQKLAILQEHCAAVGRSYDEIIPSTNLNCFVLAPGEDPEKATAAARGTLSFEEFTKGTFVAEPAALKERVGQIQEAGATYLIVYLHRLAHDHEQMHRFADGVIPAFT